MNYNSVKPWNNDQRDIQSLVSSDPWVVGEGVAHSAGVQRALQLLPLPAHSPNNVPEGPAEGGPGLGPAPMWEIQ